MLRGFGFTILSGLLRALGVIVLPSCSGFKAIGFQGVGFQGLGFKGSLVRVCGFRGSLVRV